MLDATWLSLRQAQQALKNGRLEEAERILQLPAVRSHRRVGELLTILARGYVERAERYLRLEDAEGAWRDLLRAERLGTAGKSTDRLRQTLTALGMAELRALLEAGETGRADECLALLRQRGVRSPEVQVLEDALRSWLFALDAGSRGEFPTAVEAVERARRLLPANRALEKLQLSLVQRRDTFPALLSSLFGAAHSGRWREVIEKANQVLALAPQHAEARALWTRAWNGIEPSTLPIKAQTAQEETATEEGAPRFLLWIDGVGGYLVCLGGRLTFGQAAPDAHVDIPLVADVSRLHAGISRDGEGYVLEAVRPIQVNGKSVARAALVAGDRVTLGTSFEFQFNLPVPGSTTAKIDVMSRHRLPHGIDGVLLLAQTLVLGDGPQAHVQVPDMKHPVILFRHKDGLGLRTTGEVRVNGAVVTGRMVLPGRTGVIGDEWGFALEPA
jgi:tetratricopeptide (TPR) repeat protein